MLILTAQPSKPGIEFTATSQYLIQQCLDLAVGVFLSTTGSIEAMKCIIRNKSSTYFPYNHAENYFTV